MVKLGKSLISWSSKQQKSVTLSSTESEYVAMVSGLQESLWISAILKELNLYKQESLILYCDNQSAIKLGSNPVQHGRTKHIDVRYHFIRELVENRVQSNDFNTCRFSYQTTWTYDF